MNIFISNDDGIDFEGLRSLIKAFNRLGDVYVVAPEGQRSSTSHHLTCFGKVRFEERKVLQRHMPYGEHLRIVHIWDWTYCSRTRLIW